MREIDKILGHSLSTYFQVALGGLTQLGVGWTVPALPKCLRFAMSMSFDRFGVLRQPYIFCCSAHARPSKMNQASITKVCCKIVLVAFDFITTGFGDD